MAYQLLGDDGSRLDAHFEFDGPSLIYRSRGGSRASAPVNLDYLPGLRLLLRRLHDAGVAIERGWVDSKTVQALSLDQREIFGPDDQGAAPDQVFTLLTRRMTQVGRADGARAGGGNPTKRIKLKLSDGIDYQRVVTAIGGTPVDADFRSDERIPANELGKVTPEHLWRAVQKLTEENDHEFGPSTDYDVVLENGTRLAPKAVFGIAATEALGRQILPRHFIGGLGSICFRALEDAGFVIVPKGEAQREESGGSDDPEWREGTKELRKHLTRERASGLREAKKAEFRRQHDGQLFCERCKMDPVAVFRSTDGEACIEVHHRKVQVKDMPADHKTRLEDLECLCANCHRVVHRLLRKRGK
jgi:hypothetical protein